jgi:lactate racemase
MKLAYGKTFVEFEDSRFKILGTSSNSVSLSDADLNRIFDEKPVEDIVNSGETVLFVVPDATRQCASGQIVNLLVRRLIANGTMPFDMRIIFATGIHRKVTDEEKSEILSPFIFQRIKILDHNPRDISQIVKLGETKRGTPIELNRALLEHNHIITIGGINWHYFAGFGGGRKLICPGLASNRTINETHKLAFDFDSKTRHEGVGIGLLAGNQVHEEFVEIVEKINPSYSVNVLTNEEGSISRVFCGEWKTSFAEACEKFATENSSEILEKRDVVIVSSGGFPHDINLIQAHKALENAASACADGGTIIWLAECADGIGRNDFLKWFEAENSEKLAEMLVDKYQVNGQTAWSLMKKLEKFNVVLISNLPESETRQMRISASNNIENALAAINFQSGYILPFGSKIRIIS